jgi:hypothetical protein
MPQFQSVLKFPMRNKQKPGTSEHREEVQDPSLEQIYTIGSLGNMLTWGDQQIPEPVDEVADIHAIAYDQKGNLLCKGPPRRGGSL